MTTQKVNLIKRKIGAIFCQIGFLKIRQAFHIKPKVVNFAEIKYFIKNNCKLDIRLNPADSKYSIINWATMKEIISVDWTDTRKYKKQIWDCDDFSHAFKSHVSEIFEINSVGSVWGYIYDKNTKQKRGAHLWNAIISLEDNGQLHLFWYEAMNDLWVEHFPNQKIIIKNWEYEPRSIRF